MYAPRARAVSNRSGVEEGLQERHELAVPALRARLRWRCLQYVRDSTNSRPVQGVTQTCLGWPFCVGWGVDITPSSCDFPNPPRFIVGMKGEPSYTFDQRAMPLAGATDSGVDLSRVQRIHWSGAKTRNNDSYRCLLLRCWHTWHAVAFRACNNSTEVGNGNGSGCGQKPP